MIIDASGVIGTKFSPYYPESITSEPSPFTNLATKNTFVKIEGWGLMIYQSYPNLEPQGANLTIEVALRAVILFMKVDSMLFFMQCAIDF
jgi:hypothetical protein